MIPCLLLLLAPALAHARIFLGLLLPSGEDCSGSLYKEERVREEVKKGVNEAARRFGLGDWATISSHHIGCCEDQVSAVHAAIEFADKLDAKDRGTAAALGPVCIFQVASAMRVLSYYRLPLLTPGGYSSDFNNRVDYPRLTRLGPSNALMVDFLEFFLRERGWGKFFYGYEYDPRREKQAEMDTVCKPLGDDLGGRFRSSANSSVTFAYALLKTVTDPKSARRWLATNVGRDFGVVVLCGRTNRTLLLLEAAMELKMNNGEYVFLVIDFTLEEELGSALRGVGQRGRGAVKMVRVGRGTDNSAIASFFDAVLLVAAAHKAAPHQPLADHLWNRSVIGRNGRGVFVGEDGHVASAISLLDFAGGKFQEVAFYQPPLERIQESGNMTWPGPRAPRDTPTCGYDDSGCPPKGLEPWSAALISVSVVILVFTIVSVFIYRHYKLESELAAMTWRIRWEELSGAVGESKTRGTGDSSDDPLLNLTPEHLSPVHPSSPFLPNHINNIDGKPSSMVREHALEDKLRDAVFYKGVRVYLKRLNVKRTKIELTRDVLVQLKAMRDLEHEHVVRLLGAVIEGPKVFLVSEWCGKGTLFDLLEGKDSQGLSLEPMMVRSLLHDLVKGMSFIHASEIRSHGYLTSKSCALDSRFVLKIAGFGLPSLRRLKVQHPPESAAHWAGRLWTAPELLRKEDRPVEGTQKGDVYSFAIVLHEMLFRKGPFNLKESPGLSAEEVVKGVMSGKGDWRPRWEPKVDWEEALSELMVRCWAELPAARPDFVYIKRLFRDLNKDFESSNLVENLLQRMEQHALNLETKVEERTADYVEEKRKVENLLHQLLPRSVAVQLMRGDEVRAESYSSVTIYFSDIVGFTHISSQSSPIQIVRMLNALYTLFDDTIEEFTVYKVETIGDAYMVVSGLPERIGDVRAASEIAKMSLKLLHRVQSFQIPHRPQEKLNLRIGLHSGPVVAGVVGVKMPRYCLFGDTVNTASRMESNGLAQRVHVSSTTAELLESMGGFQLELRGEVEMKGKGIQTTYWLHSHLSPTKPTPV